VSDPTSFVVAVDGVKLGDGLDQIQKCWGPLKPTYVFSFDGDALVEPAEQPRGEGHFLDERVALLGALGRAKSVQGRSLTINGKLITEVGQPNETVLKSLGQSVPGLLQREGCGNSGPMKIWTYLRHGVVISILVPDLDAICADRGPVFDKFDQEPEFHEVYSISIDYHEPDKGR
jgi:hypothetical protein